MSDDIQLLYTIGTMRSIVVSNTFHTYIHSFGHTRHPHTVISVIASVGRYMKEMFAQYIV